MNGIRIATAFGTFAVALLVGGCNGDDDGPAPGNVLVYEFRGSLQCTSDGKSPEQSAMRLIEAGIDVLASTCGYATGIYHPTVCGAGTNDILVHEIREVNLPDAEAVDFAAIESLVDPAAGIGYELINCADRPPVPVS